MAPVIAKTAPRRQLCRSSFSTPLLPRFSENSYKSCEVRRTSRSLSFHLQVTNKESNTEILKTHSAQFFLLLRWGPQWPKVRLPYILVRGEKHFASQWVLRTYNGQQGPRDSPGKAHTPAGTVWVPQDPGWDHLTEGLQHILQFLLIHRQGQVGNVQICWVLFLLLVTTGSRNICQRCRTTTQRWLIETLSHPIITLISWQPTLVTSSDTIEVINNLRIRSVGSDH